MACVETFKCDSCGCVKKETNNWFTILKLSTYYITKSFDLTEALEGKSNPNYMHACDIVCANKIQARLMAKMQGNEVTKESTPICEKMDYFTKKPTQDELNRLTD